MTNLLGRPKAEDLLVLKDLIEAGRHHPVGGLLRTFSGTLTPEQKRFLIGKEGNGL